MIISTSSIYTEGFTKFEIIVYDIFDFLERFELSFFFANNAKNLRWIMLKLSGIIAMLSISFQHLIKFETAV